jgi:hypothetical protein
LEADAVGRRWPMVSDLITGGLLVAARWHCRADPDRYPSSPAWRPRRRPAYRKHQGYAPGGGRGGLHAGDGPGSQRQLRPPHHAAGAWGAELAGACGEPRAALRRGTTAV